MTVDLYYWPGIPGRGEYVRLVLEAAEVPYRDMARLAEDEGGGVAGMQRFLKGQAGVPAPFAPPFIVDGDLVLAQTPAICAHLGEKYGLAPDRTADRLLARQIALTTADLVAEAHDVHHPVGGGLYFEDQRVEARRRAAGFRAERIPKFLRWYEGLVAGNTAGWLAGDRLSFADLGLFQTLAGLRYAFPRRMAALGGTYPAAAALAERVARHPPVAAYLDSPRRMPFNENGIFRHYPELDGEE